MEIERKYCSNSGCDSGWTHYLQSSLHNREKIECGEDHHNQFYYDHQNNEDDLSMVSDASSGPPLDLVYHDNHNDDQEDININIHNHNSNNNNNDIKKKKINNGSKFKREVKFIKSDNDFALDDTASSHFFTIPSKSNGVENNQGCSFESSIDYSSQGFSATRFQERSLNTMFEQDSYGFLEYPYPTKICQQNQW